MYVWYLLVSVTISTHISSVNIASKNVPSQLSAGYLCDGPGEGSANGLSADTS